jgi:hypothetical protein
MPDAVSEFASRTVEHARRNVNPDTSGFQPYPALAWTSDMSGMSSWRRRYGSAKPDRDYR